MANILAQAFFKPVVKRIFTTEPSHLTVRNKIFIFIVALVIYVASSIYNTGYYYFDEHYQIIEFAELKSGRNNPSDLSWEFQQKIRSGIQPLFGFAFLSIMRGMAIDDPYLLMMVLRILNGILALSCITYFVEKTRHLVQPAIQNWYLLTSYFLWFIPFINIRFSSESNSGLAFLIGLGLFFSDTRRKFLLIGLLLGLSFLLRFQTAFLSIGLITWLIIIHKIEKKQLAELVLGGMCMLILGLAVDYWFYSTLTFTPLNYFVSNIVNGNASKFGVSPWYSYFTMTLQSAIWPIGVMLWLCFLYTLLKGKCSPVIWSIIPFLLVHIMTPHKELRFLFPIINLLPITIIICFQDLVTLLNLKSSNFIRLQWLAVVILVIINIVALTLITFSPADNKGRQNITKAIHDHYSETIVLWTLDTGDPYRPIPPRQKFYEDKNVTVHSIDSLALKSLKDDVANLIVANSQDAANYEYAVKPYRLKEIANGTPAWITIVKSLFGMEDQSLSLYELVK
jgi:phosphatidylinositol glycan class B